MSIQPLATPDEVARYLKISVQSLAQMRYLGTGPKYTRLGGRPVRYFWADVEEWLASQVQAQTTRSHK